MNYAVAIALGILAFMFWREKSEDLAETQHGHLHHENTDKIDHEHSHWHKETGYHTHLHVHHQRIRPTLAAIAGFALVLGFAHEEEFVILSLAIGGVNPILLMIAYASSVAIALIGITVLAVKVYMHIQDRVISYTKYLPKISALVLAVMGHGGDRKASNFPQLGILYSLCKNHQPNPFRYDLSFYTFCILHLECL
jgi:hypothetical protein